MEPNSQNPADDVDPPKVERGKTRALDPAETAELIDHFRPTRMFMPVLLGVLCGLHRGEVTAFRWRSIDLDRGQMAINESTEQTRAGIRFKRADERGLSPCPRSSLMELRKHRVRQAEELLRLAVRHSDDVFVVAQEDGNPLQPNSLTHEFVRLLARRLALPRVRFHDLRHSHATHMLAGGVHPEDCA